MRRVGQEQGEEKMKNSKTTKSGKRQDEANAWMAKAIIEVAYQIQQTTAAAPKSICRHFPRPSQANKEIVSRVACLFGVAA
jgi:hypothetical protein